MLHYWLIILADILLFKEHISAACFYYLVCILETYLVEMGGSIFNTWCIFLCCLECQQMSWYTLSTISLTCGVTLSVSYVENVFYQAFVQQISLFTRSLVLVWVATLWILIKSDETNKLFNVPTQISMNRHAILIDETMKFPCWLEHMHGAVKTIY